MRCTSGGRTTIMEHFNKLPYGVSTFLQEQHAYTISVHYDTLEIVEDKKVTDFSRIKMGRHLLNC